jgi:cytochrome P450
VFWMLAYLLHNPQILSEYRKETEAAFSRDRLVDPFLLQNVEKCPKVDAIWNETLRLSGWSASVRLITEDTTIGDKLMRKGNRVLVPHRLLHFDENTFGGNTHEFRPDRWKKHLTRNPSWRPFGGGKTTCSGRFLARFSVTTYVATLLRRFDINMLDNPHFPKADEGRPVLGIMSIKEGSDFKVELRPRSTF